MLEVAGVDSPRNDAEVIAAHVLGVERTRLGLMPLVDDSVVAEMRALVRRRAEREPLQYVLGTAPFGPIDVEVGPGVFVPRPETESLLEWALGRLARYADPDRPPVVLDLCTGTGALALAIAHSVPAAVVHAVEMSPEAMVWARRNARLREEAGDTPITLHTGDVTSRDLLHALDGTVDVIVANPPYVPAGTEVSREVGEFDPGTAVFAGADGLDVIRPLVYNIARWLRIGGAAAIEHDETNGTGTAESFRARRVLGEVEEHDDLTGRPRYVTVSRIPTDGERRVIEAAAEREKERTDG